MSAEKDGDLLYGMPAIAAHLGLKAPQARHLSNTGSLPTFKLGKLVCARKTTIAAWLAEQEATARLSAGAHH